MGRNSTGAKNGKSKARERSINFRIESYSGHTALQLVMEPLEGLSEVSVVRGYLQMFGDTDPMHRQVTGVLQGVYFNKYGRLAMVSSQDKVYLKNSRVTPPAPQGSDSTPPHSAQRTRHNKNSTPGAGPGLASGVKSAAMRRVLAQAQANARISEVSLRRALEQVEGQGPGGDGSEMPVRLVTSEGSESVDNALELPSSQYVRHPSSFASKRCTFYLDLAAGPYLPSYCKNKATAANHTECRSGVPELVHNLTGEIVSENCKVRHALALLCCPQTPPALPAQPPSNSHRFG